MQCIYNFSCNRALFAGFIIFMRKIIIIIISYDLCVLQIFFLH